MKKLLATIALCTGTLFSANAADIYVNNSGQPGTWPTITLALAAAAPNDRIFVSPYGAYVENITIVQNVTLTSAVPGTLFNLVGTTTVIGNSNMDVRIIGCEASAGITVNVGAATLANKADVYIVDCNYPAITAQDFIVTHILFCDVYDITIRHGEIRGCTGGTFTIADGPNAGVGDTAFVVGNIFIRLHWQNDDNYFYIANNRIVTTTQSAVVLNNWHYSTVNKNLFINNTCQNNWNTSSTTVGLGCTILFQDNNNRSNIEFWNNLINNLASYTGQSYCINEPTNVVTGSGQMQSYYNYFDSPINGTTMAHVIESVAGGWTTEATPFDADGRGTNAIAIDAGSPSIQYYDIDLTRNDRGTFGGPYSIDNYLAPLSGNARVYDLNMPFEIWSGQTPQVKAESTHMK